MAVIKSGILGGGSGSVGGVTMTAWKGRAVLKAKPISVANPNTTGQSNQRGSFKGASKLFSAILSTWVIPLWNRFSGDISGFNAIMKANTKFFNASGVPTWADLVMSVGKMVPPTFGTIVANHTTDVVSAVVNLPVDATWGMNGESAYVSVYNSTQGYWLVGTATGNPNASVTVSFTDTKVNAADALKFFAAIKRTDGTQVSNSIFSAVSAT